MIRLWLVPYQSSTVNNSDNRASAYQRARPRPSANQRARPVQTLHCTDVLPEPGDHIQDLVSRVNKKIQHKHIKGAYVLRALLKSPLINTYYSNH